jgi:hypothetical protein
MSSGAVKVTSTHITGIPQILFYEYETLLETSVIKPENARKIIKYSFGIEVDGDGSTSRNFIKDPYFKIYDGKTSLSSDNLVRISIFRPEYIIHNNDRWELSSNEKKNLMKLLKHVSKTNNKTIWTLILESCIYESEMFIKMTDEFKENFMKTPIPDYMKLS